MKSTQGIALSRRGLFQAGTAVAAGAALSAAWPDAAAASDEPTLLYGRAVWNARPPSSPVSIISAPDTIVIHHAVWPNTMDFSLDRAAQVSREIQDLHMDQNGWRDSGQQLTVGRGGHVMEGRHRSFEAIRYGQNVHGAHVGGHNHHTIGIESEGTYTDADTIIPSGQFGSLVQTCSWLCQQYGLNPYHAIAGHRDFNNTICPGDALYQRLPELRQRTAQHMEQHGR
ncbi:peptidoglycan recognition protein family protein [Haloglycomyces albus]|uniref:peptidoglycan recognition protein family protein n=1 Tax=Haloglycomyces albus TaxID=526067 RepID=UPI0004ADFEBA|nr:peptidoglycan recognition family protein [Haloglycomyces albus]